MKQAKRIVIKYDEQSVSALRACREYVEQASAFLAGHGEFPSPLDISTSRFPSSSFERVRSGKDEIGSYIAAVIHDRPTTGEGSNERFFDPWYFTVMLLL